MSKENVSLVVIGAGVVGCAVAYELAQKGYAPVVLEQGPRIAEGVTSRNSGVIHAGLYYPPGSLKAESCIRGKALLYEWCKNHDVAYRRTGKWIVGAKDQELELAEFFENAKNSGATGISLQSKTQIEKNIPNVRADIAVFSEETGIIDPFEYSRSFQIAAEELGASFLMNAEVNSIERKKDHQFLVETSRGPMDCEIIVNCAGLYSDKIAKMVGIEKYTIYPCRGDYFRWRSPTRFETLIYPMKKKNAPGLGIHLTVAIDGSLRLGPDTEYVSSKEAFGDPQNLDQKKLKFFEAASTYLKDIRLEQLTYDSCGIRPKLRSPQEPKEKDFVISQDLPGFINFIGIESPGLTASRDLAQRVAALL